MKLTIGTSGASYDQSHEVVIFIRIKKTSHRDKHFIPKRIPVRQLLDILFNFKVYQGF